MDNPFEKAIFNGWKQGVAALRFHSMNKAPMSLKFIEHKETLTVELVDESIHSDRHATVPPLVAWKLTTYVFLYERKIHLLQQLWKEA